MRCLALILLILSCSATLCGQAFPFREEHPFAQGGDEGRAMIELKDHRLKRDATYSLEYNFYVTNGSYDVYNWQFISLLPLPGQLAVYNDKKEYVGDFLHWSGGSQRTPSDGDWTFLYGGSHVGSSLEIRFERVAEKLPAGTYYIQLILYQAFLSPNPRRILGEPIDFYKTFDRSELCRSNVIKVEIIDR
jgi:hypothetical protein